MSRPRAAAPKAIGAKVARLRAEGLTWKMIARELGFAKTTLWRAMRDYEQANESVSKHISGLSRLGGGIHNRRVHSLLG